MEDGALAGLLALGLAAVHLFASKLRFLDVDPRSRWLSMAGGIVLNVLKEELPAERESRFSAFVLSAGGYAAILLLL